MVSRMEKQYIMVKTRCSDVNNNHEFVIPNSERWLSLEDLPNERWKDIKDFEGFYKISDYGRVKSLKRTTTKEHILKIYYTERGYCRVNLCKNNNKKNFFVHSLVMKTFDNNHYDIVLQINHKDENKANNCIYNLEWCNNVYNIRYGTGIERSKQKKYKSVIQYTMLDEFVSTYESIQKASIVVTTKHNKSGVRYISDCAKGYKSLYMGFKWKFKDCEDSK